MGDFGRLMERMGPLGDAAQALTPLALREDAGAIATLSRYPRELIDTLRNGRALNDPFSTILEEVKVNDEFLRNWLDMLSFLLQGLPATGTMNAVMAYMLADWYRPGVTLDFPKGGSGAIVDALVRGVEKHGLDNGRVCTDCHVEEILVEGGRAVGVKLRGGRVVRARKAVVSNADPYVTKRILQKARERGETGRELDDYMDGLTGDRSEPSNDDGREGEGKGNSVPNLRSFIHIHAGITSEGLPPVPNADFPAQWAVVRSWDRSVGGVEAPRNIVLCSIPSLIDPDLAPDGHHVIHAYVPATEPYEDWEGMDRDSEEYREKKREAEDFLWSAIEEYIPNARERAVKGTVQIGTPLTHERFLRRTRGAYG